MARRRSRRKLRQETALEVSLDDGSQVEFDPPVETTLQIGQVQQTVAHHVDEGQSRDLTHSKRLDVHRWSEHGEVNKLVDNVYLQLREQGNKNIRKKHVKVVLLDLYVNWRTDPTLCTSYSRNPNEYRASSIYNELHISKTTIEVVDGLIAAGLAHQAKGFYDRRTGIGKQSRMWPSEALIRQFEKAAFSVFDVGWDASRFPIELRDDNKKRIEFELTPELKKIANELQAYNSLLRRTFVSLSNLQAPENGVDKASGTTRASQTDKYVRRVFNRSSFRLGGRFYGGWWQNCPSQIRRNILINDRPTNELDYSSLHPTIVYALEDRSIWDELKGADPYQIEALSFECDAVTLRNLAKSLTLILINAENTKIIPSALRDKAYPGSKFKRLTDNQIFEAVDAIAARLPILSGYIGKGIGLELQYIDSELTRSIVNEFTAKGIPVLTVHDSYIVPVSFERELEASMERAFRSRFGKRHAVLLKYKDVEYEHLWDEVGATTAHSLYMDDAQKEAANLEVQEILEKFKPARSSAYLSELDLFLKWLKANKLPCFEPDKFSYR